jgi:glycosyltransferase involved in cell wall biosynthesis
MGNPEGTETIFNNTIQGDVFISIIITVYKRKNYLKEAVDSICNQYRVDKNFEVLIMDDDPNSSMDTISKFKSYQNLAYYRNKNNIGLYNNVNLGVQLSKGLYVSFLHDDDLLYPNYLQIVCYFLTTIKPSAKCVIPNRDITTTKTITNHKNIHPVKNFIKKSAGKSKNIFREFTQTNGLIYTLRNIYCAPSCGTIFERDEYLQCGGFKQEYWPISDYIFFVMFNKHNRVYFLNEKLGNYRWLENLSQDKQVQYLNLKQYIEFYKTNQFSPIINLYYKIFYREAVYAKFLMLSNQFRNEVMAEYPWLGQRNAIKWNFFYLFNQIYGLFHGLIA